MPARLRLPFALLLCALATAVLSLTLWHERWDGAGYPNGVAGEAISAGARLLALAEAWDSMTSSRVYGDALSSADALAECKRERGTQFAPEAVDALDRLWALGALDSTDRAEALQRGE